MALETWRTDNRGIPQRKLGKADVTVSALAMGGHYIGDAQDQRTEQQLMDRAVDAVITFFDNSWEYQQGKCEEWMGTAARARVTGCF